MGQSLRPRVKLAPSILSADFARLGEQVAEAERAGADYIHVDVMDGHFVPNITFGPMVVEAIRPHTRLPLDVHLMVYHPEALIPRFARAGADIITVHAEACTHLHRTLQQIRELGKRAGVAINPATPALALEEALPFADLVLVMTVDPGFPAQRFIPTMQGKVARVRRMLEGLGLETELEVDGGINRETAPQVASAGANVLVAGSAVFCHPGGVATAIREIRDSLGCG